MKNLAIAFALSLFVVVGCDQKKPDDGAPDAPGLTNQLRAPGVGRTGVADDGVKPVAKTGIPDDSIKPVAKTGVPDDSIKPIGKSGVPDDGVKPVLLPKPATLPTPAPLPRR